MKATKRRVFIKNLPETATQAEIEKIFSDYGTIDSVEIKERKTVLGEHQSLFFAYVNLETTDQNIQKCLQDFASEPWHGQYVELQEAKESFLDRLKRERQEQNGNKATTNYQKINPSSSTNTVQTCKIKGKLASSSSESESESSSDNDVGSPKTNGLAIPVRVKKSETSSSSSDEEANETKTQDVEQHEIVFKSNKHKTLADVYTLKIESVGKAPVATIEDRRKKPKRKKAEELTNSDSKRIKSMQNMIDRYKQQKNALKTSLSNVDFKPKHKIVFNDTEEVEVNTQNADICHEASNNNQTIDLFGSDQDSGNEDIADDFNFEVKKQFEGKKGQKLLELQSKYKSDQRFKLDERFIEDDEQPEDPHGNNSSSYNQDITVEEEKKKEFEILEQILGSRIKSNVNQDGNISSSCNKHKGMLRFDPSVPDHSKYELRQETGAHSKTNKKTKKGEESVVENNTELPVVSKDVFYKVQEDLLKETFQESSQGFSLLQMFGKGDNKQESQPEEGETVKINKSKKKTYGDEITNKNPFRYDSSSEDEDEEGKREENIDAEIYKKDVKDAVLPSQQIVGLTMEPFFFKEDDFRFQEGLDYVKRIGSKETDDFVGLRRKLKEVVKSKIKNNQRKVKMFKKKLGGRKKNSKNSQKKTSRIRKAMNR